MAILGIHVSFQGCKYFVFFRPRNVSQICASHFAFTAILMDGTIVPRFGVALTPEVVTSGKTSLNGGDLVREIRTYPKKPNQVYKVGVSDTPVLQV